MANLTLRFPREKKKTATGSFHLVSMKDKLSEIALQSRAVILYSKITGSRLQLLSCFTMWALKVKLRLSGSNAEKKKKVSYVIE